MNNNIIRILLLSTIVVLGLFSCKNEELFDRKEEMLENSQSEGFELNASLATINVVALDDNATKSDNLRASLSFNGETSVATSFFDKEDLMSASWGLLYGTNSDIDGGTCTKVLDKEPDIVPLSNTLFVKMNEGETTTQARGTKFKMYCKPSKKILGRRNKAWFCLDGRRGTQNGEIGRLFFKDQTNPNARIEGLLNSDALRLQKKRHIPFMTGILPFEKFDNKANDVKIKPRGSLIGLLVKNSSGAKIIITGLVVKKSGALDYSGYFDFNTSEDWATFTASYPSSQNTSALVFPVYQRDESSIGYPIKNNNAEPHCFYVWGFQNPNKKGEAFEVQIRYKLSESATDQLTSKTFLIKPSSDGFKEGYAYNAVCTLNAGNKAGGSTATTWKDTNPVAQSINSIVALDKGNSSLRSDSSVTNGESQTVKNNKTNVFSFIVKANDVELSDIYFADSRYKKRYQCCSITSEKSGENTRKFTVKMDVNQGNKAIKYNFIIDVSASDSRKFTLIQNPNPLSLSEQQSKRNTPLDYVAEGLAINKRLTGFVPDASFYYGVYADAYVSGLDEIDPAFLSFEDANKLFREDFMKNYTLPTRHQWCSIFPYYNYDASVQYVQFKQVQGRRTLREIAQVGPYEAQEYQSEYLTKKEGSEYVTYARRFIGTKWESAWRYSRKRYKDFFWHDNRDKKRYDFEIRCVKTNGSSLSSVSSPNFFKGANVTIRIFPAYGECNTSGRIDGVGLVSELQTSTDLGVDFGTEEGYRQSNRVRQTSDGIWTSSNYHILKRVVRPFYKSLSN